MDRKHLIDIGIKNNFIKKKNSLIKEAQDKIQNLKKWHEYIEFNGEKYGVPTILNNIHRTDDCNGDMILINSTYEECNKCENGMWSCGRNCSYRINYYKCENCGFKTSKKQT